MYLASIRTGTFLALAGAFATVGCKDERPTATANTAAMATATTNARTPALATVTSAKVGEEAPDFELKDLDGKSVRLSSFRGKVIVLEWFNPGCPFVKNAHNKGPLVSTAAKSLGKGVVWLAVNSSAAGREGAGASANAEARIKWSLNHPILLDESGATGKMYGATNTPHIMIVDKSFKLAYRGAADNSPDGEGESPTGGTLVNYVDTTVDALLAGKPAPLPETKAYGCSVKYAK
jgi:Redoxin